MPHFTAKHFEGSSVLFLLIIPRLLRDMTINTLPFNRVRLKSKPLIIDMEQFVKNTEIIEFQACVWSFGEFTDRCRRSSSSKKFLLKCKSSFLICDEF